MAQAATKAAHSVSLTLAEPLPGRLDAGAALSLKFAAVCAEGCDLAGHAIQLRDARGETVASGALFEITAPATAGHHAWSLVYPRQEDAQAIHAQAVLPISFETVPHETSLAAWDIPSPVVMDDMFTLTVGATCTTGCALAGRQIEIHDAAGNLAGAGMLGQTVWPETRALYWTQIPLRAPKTEGRAEWTLRFAPAELDLPHAGTSFQFSVQIVPPAEHTALVKVTEKDSGAALDNAQVRLGLYAATTSKDGTARLRTPTGVYELDVLKTGYDAEPIQVEIASDKRIEITMTVVPKDDPHARWYLQPDKT